MCVPCSATQWCFKNASNFTRGGNHCRKTKRIKEHLSSDSAFASNGFDIANASGQTGGALASEWRIVRHGMPFQLSSPVPSSSVFEILLDVLAAAGPSQNGATFASLPLSG
jgi:hypothetical protein